MAENIDFFFKIIIIGDSSVGKSKLLCSYLDKEEKKEPTIGVDMCCKDIKIDGQMIRLKFWDMVKKGINTLLVLIIKKLWVFSLFMMLPQKNHLIQLTVGLKM